MRVGPLCCRLRPAKSLCFLRKLLLDRKSCESVRITHTRALWRDSPSQRSAVSRLRRNLFPARDEHVRGTCVLLKLLVGGKCALGSEQVARLCRVVLGTRLDCFSLSKEPPTRTSLPARARLERSWPRGPPVQARRTRRQTPLVAISRLIVEAIVPIAPRDSPTTLFA